MMRRVHSSPSLLLLLLSVAAVVVAGCNKDKKGDDDASADAEVDGGALAVAADAAPEASDVDAGAAANAGDAATPLATATVARPVVKPKPDPPICVNARAAKARNSPAAPGLAAQCKAQGGTL